MGDRHLTRSAVMLILTRPGEKGLEVLLQLRQNTGYADGCWDFAAAGHVDAGESMKMAVRREAAEELGIDMALEDITFATLNHKNGEADGKVYYNVFFTARAYSGEPRILEPHKCGGLAWFSEHILPDAMIPDRRRALENWLSGIPYTEEGWQ